MANTADNPDKDASTDRPVLGVSRLGYISSLDGLRTIAVLSVIVAHSDIGAVKTAVGVDIFFVLSGFLITHILVEEWSSTGRINILNFYARRILRLWPALWVMILSTSISLYLSGMNKEMTKSLALGVISALCYVSNWFRAFGLDSIYGHTWSLGVEEQFYIVWGLLLPLGLSTVGLSKMRSLTLGAIGCVILWRTALFLSGSTTARIYNGFDTHIDGCLMGCALAFFLVNFKNRSLVRNRLRAFPFIGLAALCALIVVSVALPSTDDPVFYYVPGMSLIYLLAAFVIADAVTEGGYIRKLLGLRVLVRLGVISYGIYLWHYPLIMAISYVPNYISSSSASKLVIGLVGGVGMAELSYRIVETPFLRLKSNIARRAVLKPGNDRLLVGTVAGVTPPPP